jgi:hypothetical protein
VFSRYCALECDAVGLRGVQRSKGDPFRAAHS